MLHLHAIWVSGELHVWAEAAAGGAPGGAKGDASATPDSAAPMAVVPVEELQREVGDFEDGLLVFGASPAELRLRWPHCDGRPCSSQGALREPIELRELTVPTLCFPPADAIDLLTGLPRFERHTVRSTGSLRYWSRAAELVLELLARQYFVPDVYRAANGAYEGYWRVVIADEDTTRRVAALVSAMPPVCRAVGVGDADAAEPAELVENFLWTTVDALVRRCLEGDELAHAVHDRHSEAESIKTVWLRALVGEERVLAAPVEVAGRVAAVVSDWLAALAPPQPQRTCRTCLRLHPPDPRGAELATLAQKPWLLTVHVQAIADEQLVLDAAQLWEATSDQPAILHRPFDGARDQVRADLASAARHFEPLALAEDEPCPAAFTLSLEEAHRFLRDVAVVLEMEGVAVWLPSWWRSERARLGLRLEVQPTAPAPPGSEPIMRLDSLVGYDWRVALGADDVSLEEISALVRQKAPLVHLRGRWVELQPAEVDKAVEFLQRSPRGQMTLLEALRRGYMAEDSDTGLPVLGLQATGWVRELLEAAPGGDKVGTVEPPPGFHGSLRPYQQTGLAWLAFLSRHGLGSCLADDMGLGKTIQTIGLWLQERLEGKQPGPTLLVVPMSLVGNWQREIARFAPTLRVLVHHGLDRLSGEDLVEEAPQNDVVISTYGLIHRDFDYLQRVAWHRVALDEAQNIKNPAAKQTQALRRLSAVHRLALTGTPVENRLTELWSILEFLNPGYLGPAAEFRRRFAVPIERYHDEDRAARLRRLIRPFVLRRDKRDPNILRELPERLDMKVYCNLTREQAALYEAVVQDMLGQIDHAGGIQRRGLILATLVQLKQICNHPAHYLLARPVPGAQRPDAELFQRSGKCERLREMLEEVVAEGDAALVFTQFRQMGNLLQRYLQEALDREVIFMHGGTTQKQRDAMVERFQEARGQLPVFLLSLRAGGVGLNLTAANHVFHFDRWWNPAVEEQATDRAHRIGQLRMVQVHKFVCAGTLEERIDAMIEQKKDLAQRIVGAGEEWVTELSTDALRDLFALSRDAVAESE